MNKLKRELDQISMNVQRVSSNLNYCCRVKNIENKEEKKKQIQGRNKIKLNI